ncbi:Mcph1 [Anthophora quadrimaculata]
MIDDKILNTENDVYFQNVNNLSFSNLNGYIKYVHGELRSSGKSRETDTINTVRTSLNVNTSVDVENQGSTDINKYKWENREKKKCTNLENTSKDMHSTISEARESINTNSTSLQMNTSLDASNQLQRRNNTVNDFTIKNLSLRRNGKSTFHSYNTETDSINDQKLKSCKPQHEDQIVLHKSHNNKDIVSNIILNNSSCEMSYVQMQTSMDINASTDKSDMKENQTVKHLESNPVKGKSRRKLLPIGECSQLASFSPVQKEYSPQQSITFKKKNKRRNRYNKKIHINNTECNTPKENENYNKKKQIKKPRKIISKKIVVKKIVDEDILKILEKDKQNINQIETDVSPLKRSSTNDFQPLKKSSWKQLQRINIVATGLSNEDKDMVKSIVKILGSAKFESNVTKRTTHVISTGVRTVKLLHGIIRGCWLVTLEWVLKSFENGVWLNPESYEMAHFSKTVQENRKDRQLFGKYYTPELFIACGYIYVQKTTTPPCDILKDLIKAAGGRITEDPETAKILIGTEGLKESWILDCITSGELQPYNQYQRS